MLRRPTLTSTGPSLKSRKYLVGALIGTVQTLVFLSKCLSHPLAKSLVVPLTEEVLDHWRLYHPFSE